MGWSISGCDHMAKLRAFKGNNGKTIDLLRHKKGHREKLLRQEEERELLNELRKRKSGWRDEEKMRALIPGLETSSMKWLLDMINNRMVS